jgi:very-short-patch-repair endonuclease
VKKHPPSISIARARDLRRNPTDAEKRMRRLLKEFFPSARFRQQVPIRHYIADFASHREKIVIEIDGGQHTSEQDNMRSRAIEAEGFRIIRFWNNEVLENGDGCAIRLGKLLRPDHPHPTPASQQAAKPAYPSPIKGEAGGKS